jgi:hypothetical protein
MGVNRYKEHLVIYLEDQPYRSIVNGVKSLPGVNDRVIDAKPPCGGWGKVFAELEENLKLLNSRETMYALLLIDFDNDFARRKQRFDTTLQGQACQHRVFMLGIDNKESEDLKAALRASNNEAVGTALLEGCPDSTADEWENAHLRCNQEELRRIRSAGVFEWLFG